MRGQSPVDFKSTSLTTRTNCLTNFHSFSATKQTHSSKNCVLELGTISPELGTFYDVLYYRRIS